MVQIIVRRSGSGSGEPRREEARSTLKIAVFAPIPRANMTTAAMAKPRERKRTRNALRTSCRNVSVIEPSRESAQVKLCASRREMSNQRKVAAQDGTGPEATVHVGEPRVECETPYWIWAGF